jgi:hypothetical protein
VSGEDDASDFVDDALEVLKVLELGCTLDIYPVRCLKDLGA